MILSKSFFRSCLLILLSGLLVITGCARPTSTRQGDDIGGKEHIRIAVFPILNLSGTPAPLNDLRQLLVKGLTDSGIGILEEETLQGYMTRHRLRYTGGIDIETSRTLKEETGVDAVLITTVELYNYTFPPKISLWSRLVSTGSVPKIIWMDGKAMAGNDSPGILGLGLIDDPKLLLKKAVRALLDSLSASLVEVDQGARSAGKTLQPKVEYRLPSFNPAMKYRVAIVPFFDLSGRKNAGEIMQLQFLNAMKRFKNFELIEPGMVRAKMLSYRIILWKGVSMANADILFDVLDADLILGGTIYKYDDYQGGYGVPEVEFSAQLLDRRSREMVWSSKSINKGDDRVYFFDIGKINTAQTLAIQMVRGVMDQMVAK
jgi:hypothetical protein